MSKPESACLVLNGKAALREDVRTAVHAVRDEGYRVEVRVTWEGGDAERFARQAAEGGFDRVLVGGGDGTVNEVVNGLVGGVEAEEPLPGMGIVPLGTANDFATASGIPLDPLVAMRLALSQPTTLVDVGRVNGRCFLNMATGGFGAESTAETSLELKSVLGKAAYLLTALTRFTSIRSARGRLSGPGLNWEGEFLVLAVGNGRQAGGGYQLCPEAVVNDGLLDVRVLSLPATEELSQVVNVLLGKGLEAVRRTVVSARVSALRVEAEETLQLNLDGEPVAGTRFQFEVLSRRLPLVLPPDSPLLA